MIAAWVGGCSTAKKDYRDTSRMGFPVKSLLLQSIQGVRADPLFVFEFDTPLFEFRAETPTLEPLFALPTTTGIQAVPFFISPFPR